MADVLDGAAGMLTGFEADGRNERTNERTILGDCSADDRCYVQVGFAVLAAVPDSGYVYPLLGRPHDALSPPDANDGYVVFLGNVDAC